MTASPKSIESPRPAGHGRSGKFQCPFSLRHLWIVRGWIAKGFDICLPTRNAWSWNGNAPSPLPVLVQARSWYSLSDSDTDRSAKVLFRTVKP